MRLLGTPATFCHSRFGLVVLAEDGDVELVLGQAVLPGDQVPGELDGFGFEIIAEGKIAQHLEEGVMAARIADVLQVVMFAAGAHAFLRAGGARVVALLEAEESVLELVHPRVGEQQSGIVGGNQRRAAHHAVAARGKEIEKTLSGFVTCHGDSLDIGGLNPIVAKWGREAGARAAMGSARRYADWRSSRASRSRSSAISRSLDSGDAPDFSAEASLRALHRAPVRHNPA